MTLLGPVSNAAGGGNVNPWFSIAVGLFVLIGAWGSYLQRKDQQEDAKVSMSSLIFISGICAVFIGFGVWNLVKG